MPDILNKQIIFLQMILFSRGKLIVVLNKAKKRKQLKISIYLIFQEKLDFFTYK